MKKIISVLMAVVTLLSVLVSFNACKITIDMPETTTEETTVVEETTVDTLPAGINALTGEYDALITDENNRMVAIVVENTPAARPQWGLTSPDILMEYEVEGGITRMLWLYANSERIPEKVGPVRSARHDVVEIAYGFNAIFVHWGGSTFAYEKIREYDKSLSRRDGMYHKCFFRDTTRNVSSEHTGYTKGSSLRNSFSYVGFSSTHNEDYVNPFKFSQTPRILSVNPCNSMKISYSSSYNYTFNYNTATGKYDTLINGNPRVDDKGVQCAYTNVIILYTDIVSLETAKGHQEMLLENGGKGIYASGGTYEEITWTKTAETEPIKLFDIYGNPLELNTGNSYLGLVRSTRSANTVIS